MEYLIFGITLVASFVFALGGVGTGLVLVPILTSLGLPLGIVKPITLFNNGASMMSASISNIKNKRIDYKIALPLVLSSLVFAVVGAYISDYIPLNVLLIVFTIFLTFTGLLFLFQIKKEKDNYREDKPFGILFIVGALAGIFSGILGIGGGGVISPFMLMLGFDPKKTTAITALAIPFSSFPAFITYWIMGDVDWKLIFIVSVAGIIGATLGTSFMHKKLDQKAVKKILAFILLAMAVNMLVKVF